MIFALFLDDYLKNLQIGKILNTNLHKITLTQVVYVGSPQIHLINRIIRISLGTEMEMDF